MKVMIVDDEQLIRRHLVELQEWKQLGCSIVGEAGNGQEALQLAHLCKPDLIITDIRMPLMDGMQLAEAVRALYPRTHIIFISAFHDFMYAKQALKLGAIDFITKPIDLGELLEAVELVMEGANHSNVDERLHQEKLVRLLLSEKGDADEIEKQAGWSEVAGKQTMIFSIEIDNIELAGAASDPHSLFMLREMTCHVMARYPYRFWICLNRKGVYLIIFQPDGRLWDMKTDSMQIARDIISHLQDSFEHSISIGISQILSSVLHLRKGLEQIQECLDYRMLLGKGSIISSDALSLIRDESKRKDEIHVANLAELLHGGSKERISPFLRTVYRDMLAKGLGKHQVQQYAVELMERAGSIMEGYQLSGSAEERLETHKQILSYDILSDLLKFLEGKLAEMAEKIGALNKESVHSVIQSVNQYLEAHYQEEISLVSLSKVLHINHSYLCRLIKKEAGINFRDMLWGIRIEKAKQLLANTAIKTSLIAYEVGFKDPSHFSQLFKRIAGVSPKEYREQQAK
ncbi:response regulator [Paenibacillus eucommiae]|uniref:YesN/AraC family two-component response regulator n=1 Tax=Paenibacillus eucommiae TaxID=1355755 RepID=A0ABS4J3U2_9BACL|nr:response regulator [Paenibacillus eucommiae]MBP1994483.1 YesN/AraC family two-component response regulator [Paenibacillus eucommiae]